MRTAPPTLDLRAARLLALGALLAARPALAEAPPEGRHRPFLEAALAGWPHHAGEPGARLACLRTPDEGRLVGARQEVVVQAPLETVEAVLDDLAELPAYEPELLSVKIEAGAAGAAAFATSWERRVPVFFLPNTRYRLLHEVHRPRPGLRASLYRLRAAGDLLESDGLTVAEGLGPRETRLVTYDFLLARWGPLPSGLVWGETLRGLYLSVEVAALRAERQGAPAAEVLAEARRRWDAEGDLADRCRRDMVAARGPEPITARELVRAEPRVE